MILINNHVILTDTDIGDASPNQDIFCANCDGAHDELSNQCDKILPRYINECTECIFLGRYNYVDLYLHYSPGPQRYPVAYMLVNEYGDIHYPINGIVTTPALEAARLMAIDRGLIYNYMR